MCMFNNAYEMYICMYVLHNGLQVDKKCTQMTLAINMLKNTFPLAYWLKCKHMAFAQIYYAQQYLLLAY